MKNRIVVDQIVCVKTLDARSSSVENKEARVTKIGNKYFYLEGYNTRFSIESLFNDNKPYSSTLKVYPSKQDLIDEMEANDLLKSIRVVFNAYGTSKLSLAQLREINAIVNKII